MQKNKRNTCNALKFEINWEIECAKLYKDIMDGTYEIGRSIAFIVTKPKRERYLQLISEIGLYIISYVKIRTLI